VKVRTWQIARLGVLLALTLAPARALSPAAFSPPSTRAIAREAPVRIAADLASSEQAVLHGVRAVSFLAPELARSAPKESGALPWLPATFGPGLDVSDLAPPEGARVALPEPSPAALVFGLLALRALRCLRQRR
jgi:hypothetical protein